MDKRESFYWDVVKGIAIFLMLWGHCIQYCALDEVPYLEDVVFKTIYTFHMPVFMLVSGYLFSYSFRKRTMQELLEHRIRGMLHPILMATLLNNVLMQFLCWMLTSHASFLFGDLFFGIERDLWFLWSVLYCSMAVGFCCKRTDKPGTQLMLLSIAVVVILTLPQWNMTLFMYPYFLAGFFCGMYRNHGRRIYKLLRYAALVIFPVLVMFYETKHYIYVTPMFSEELGLTESLKIACFRWVAGFAGSLCLLTVSDYLLRVAGRISALQSVLKAIALLGRNSLQIYCLSASLLSGYLPHVYRKFVEIMGVNLFAKEIILYDYLFTPVMAAAWAVFLYYLVVLMKKTKLHSIVFGR